MIGFVVAVAVAMPGACAVADPVANRVAWWDWRGSHAVTYRDEGERIRYSGRVPGLVRELVEERRGVERRRGCSR